MGQLLGRSMLEGEEQAIMVLEIKHTNFWLVGMTNHDEGLYRRLSG